MQRPVAPMLATSGRMPPSDGRWLFEPKLDGWRVIIEVGRGVEVWTRSGRRITECVPELAPLAHALEQTATVLDAELVVGQGAPDDFYRLAGRLAATRPQTVARLARREAVTAAVFDVLRLDSDDVSQRPYADRRVVLQSLSLASSNWCTVSAHADGEALIAQCERLALEGVVAKRVDACYSPGPSSAWVKVKTAAWKTDHAPRRVERPRRSWRT